MRVLKVEAVAFGPFVGETLDLGAPMNVVCGPNEAGKSSWHAAIFAGICGRRRGKGAGKKTEQAFRADHRPWNGERWVVRVELELDDGRRVEVSQDLDEPGNSRVTDLVTGKDLTEEFLSDGAPDASRRLGLSRDTMLATATVRQTEIARVHSTSKALQQQLQAATTQAGADETAQAALDRIEEFFKEHVGLRRANAVRPLQLALNGIAEAEARLARARTAREAYQGLREARDETESELVERRGELEAAQQAFERQRAEVLRQRLREAKQLSARLPEGDPPDLDRLLTEAKRIGQVMVRFEDRPEAQELPGGAPAEVLERELTGLPVMPVGDTEVRPEVEAAHDGWRKARHAIEAHDKYRPQEAEAAVRVDAAGGELRKLADVLELPEPEPDERMNDEIEALDARARVLLWKLGVLWVGAVLLVAALGMWVMDIPLRWWLGAGIAGAVAVIIGFLPGRSRASVLREIRSLEAELAALQVSRRQTGEERRRAEDRLEELGLPLDAEQIRSLARRQEAAEASRQELESWEAERKELAAALAKQEQALAEALEGRLEASGDALADLGAAFGRYERECREHSRLARQAGRRADLEAQWKSRLALEQRATETATKREAAARDVVELAESLGMEIADPDATAEALRARAEALGREYDLWNAAREDLARLDVLLRGTTLEALEAEVAALAGDETGAAASGEGVRDPIDLGDDPETRVEALRQRFEDARQRLARLDGQIQNEESDLVSVAEAQEDLEQAEAERERVERLEVTLNTTRDFLAAARERVQRDIAPHLKNVLEANLATVTNGRYREARVDPANLEVTVKTTDGDWQSAQRLSHGTMEQIYLLLRVALVRHMCSAGEPSPIFLDDVTVQSDDQRTVAILDVLEQVSTEHQVILFSQEEEVRRWATARQVAAPEMVRLVELSSPGNP